MKRPRGICKGCKNLVPPSMGSVTGDWICMAKDGRMKKPPSKCGKRIDLETYMDGSSPAEVEDAEK